MKTGASIYHTCRGLLCGTRRNKIACIFLTVIISFVFFIWNSSFFIGGAYSTGKLCKLDDINLESDFDAEKFKGTWFGMYTKGLDNPVLSYFLEFNDIRLDFFPMADGEFRIKSIGAKFLGLWCPAGEGEASPEDKDSLAQLNIHFNTPTGKRLGTKPVWVLKTDYFSYAVVYSCWEKTEDGYCKASSAYALLLQREKIKLPMDKQKHVDGALTQACLDPRSVKPIKHKGHCIKDAMDIVV